MKKNIILLAILSVVSTPYVMADTPKVYGKIIMAVEDVSVKNSGVQDKVTSGHQVNSRSFNLGFKGSEALGDGYSAIYQMEFGVDVNKEAPLKKRNQYVGLKGGFGTVFMGRHSTPFKGAQAKDLFPASIVADIKVQSGGLGTTAKGGEDRRSNTLTYISPSLGGVKFIGALYPSERSGATTQTSSLTDLSSLVLKYGSKKEGLYLTAALNSYAKNGLKGAASSESRFVAQYAAGGVVANVMYQKFGGDYNKNTTREGVTFSGALAYKIGQFTPKLQIMQVDRSIASLKDSLNYAVGFDYKLGKQAYWFAEYGRLENQLGVKKSESSALSIGLAHKF